MTMEAEKLHDLLENQDSLVQFGLSLKVWEPGFWWEIFPLSTDSNACLCWKHSDRHTQK